jgi:methylphosphotriester-DNA--protein-cysteine methyltransferase
MATSRDKKSDGMSSSDRRKTLGAKTHDRRVQVVRVLLERSFDRIGVTRYERGSEFISLATGTRLFKVETGMSPQRYLTLVRLQRARDQLETSFLQYRKSVPLWGSQTQVSLHREFQGCLRYDTGGIQEGSFENTAGKRRRPRTAINRMRIRSAS